MKNNKKNNNSVPISPPAPPEPILLAPLEPHKKIADEKLYTNSDTCKEKILSENKNKSGIYMWTNSKNGKQYIGSAIDLQNRLSFDYSLKAMVNSLKNSQSSIYNALLKHGHENFSLTILEYCKPEQCLEREKYYLKKIKPEYNISLDPSAPMSGRKHSAKTKIIMSDTRKGITGENHPRYGKNHTEETKIIMSDVKKGEKNPMFGKNRSDKSIQIEVTDLQEKTFTYYDSFSEAVKALNLPSHNVISNYILRNQIKPYKGRYTFKKI